MNNKQHGQQLGNACTKVSSLRFSILYKINIFLFNKYNLGPRPTLSGLPTLSANNLSPEWSTCSGARQSDATLRPTTATTTATTTSAWTVTCEKWWAWHMILFFKITQSWIQTGLLKNKWISLEIRCQLGDEASNLGLSGQYCFKSFKNKLNTLHFIY